MSAIDEMAKRAAKEWLPEESEQWRAQLSAIISRHYRELARDSRRSWIYPREQAEAERRVKAVRELVLAARQVGHAVVWTDFRADSLGRLRAALEAFRDVE